MTEEPPFLTALRRNSELRPDHAAIEDERGTVTYRQLVDRVDRRVADLRQAGVRPGDRVALVADNSAGYLEAAAAVWAARAVLVTLYSSSGSSELEHCLSTSDPALVLADAGAESAVRHTAGGRAVARLDQPQLPTAGCDSPSQGTVHPDLGLICFTSGSTSRPKAVMHTNSGLDAAARAFGRTWHLGHADRVIVCLPMAWAFGLVTTSMATLIAGGTVLSFARSEPGPLAEAITDRRATVMAGVTSLYVKLVSHLERTGGAAANTLRLCISGGEPRNEEVFARWSAVTSRPVHDNYAASECFPVITYDPEADPVPVRSSAGKVVEGAEMRVVDPSGNDVASGQTGEALWRGPAMFLGYWGDSEETAKALTSDGWYRSNDLVRVDDRGYVFVEGRISDMIIRGGSNVSPGEVESVLRQHSAVRDAAVIGLPDPTYGQRVVAAVVSEDGFVEEEVDAHCRAKLAGYKVPSCLVQVQELPTNAATGKVNRRQLVAELAETLSQSTC